MVMCMVPVGTITEPKSDNNKKRPLFGGLMGGEFGVAELKSGD
jgi:hypothetical protein